MADPHAHDPDSHDPPHGHDHAEAHGRQRERGRTDNHRGHDHAHDHAPAPTTHSARQALAWALALTAGFAIVEAAGGWWSGSLALLSDAGHMLTDAAALGLALFANRIAARPPTRRVAA